ncbi:MAG: hypothetical protein ABI222_00085 [Opitutaceae bacterium]
MRRLFCLGLVFSSILTGLSAAEPDAHLLAGSWRYDATRSTELSAWGSLKLVITVAGSHVTLTRQFAAGRRTYDEVTPLDLTKPVNVVPLDWWPDNRHIGAYSGGDKTKKIHAEVLDGGRMLRTNADLTLATQQGDRAVNILSDYKVSANGQQLTLIELRSTRNDPIVYVFKRITDAAADAKASKGNAE